MAPNKDTWIGVGGLFSLTNQMANSIPSKQDPRSEPADPALINEIMAELRDKIMGRISVLSPTKQRYLLAYLELRRVGAVAKRYRVAHSTVSRSLYGYAKEHKKGAVHYLREAMETPDIKRLLDWLKVAQSGDGFEIY